MSIDATFEIYIKTYAKVRSGHTISEVDFGVSGFRGFEKHDSDGITAVSMAAEDATSKKPMRSKSEFAARLKEVTS